VFSREAANITIIVFVLIQAMLQPTIYRTRGEHANHCIPDAVCNHEGLTELLCLLHVLNDGYRVISLCTKDFIRMLIFVIARIWNIKYYYFFTEQYK